MIQTGPNTYKASYGRKLRCASFAPHSFSVKLKNNMDKNKEAKLRFITSFHKEADERIDFLVWLNNENHRQEALTLCLTYIDSFSQWLCWPSKESGRNFVQAIVKFGGNPLMGLVHPLQAIRSFEVMKPSWQQVAKKIGEVFPGPEFKLISEDTFLAKLNLKLTSKEAQDLKAECWRATLAAAAHYFLRNPSVHSFGASELSFSNTTYQGENISGIGFIDLHEIAKRLHNELRRRSEANIQWFGNDEIVGA